MKIGSRGLDLIKRYEAPDGPILRAYKPTPNDVWTVGFGHVKGVEADDVITAAEAESFLMDDIADAERSVDSLGLPLSQAQFDALVSLVFNVGPGCIRQNTAIGNALRDRDWFHAGAAFILWRKQAGNDLRGLARRRAEEMVLYFSEGFSRA